MGALRTEIMEKRIKFFSAITIFVIIVATITALFVTDAKDLASVKNVKMAHNSENSISLTWNEVKKADGYYIYIFNRSQIFGVGNKECCYSSNYNHKNCNS